jgi:hypothetical protein
MGAATYRLAKSLGGVIHYAEVTATAEFANERSIVVSPEAFSWLRQVYGPNAVVDGPGFEADRAAAESGAAFALGHITGREGKAAARVVLDRIRTNPVDTTPADIAYAACWAVWQALGVEGSSVPELPGR